MPIISTIAASVTAAAAAAGVTTFTFVASWVIGSVALGGIGALVAKNRKPKNEEKDWTRTQVFSSGPALYPLGRSRVGGVVMFWGEDWNVPNTERFNRNGGADDAHLILAVGEGECDAIEAVWIGKDRFDVKFEDDAKTIYARREKEKLNTSDPDYAAKLQGLPLDLDPGSEAYFSEEADQWYERKGGRRLDPENDDDAETIRRAALSGSISLFPYLDASGNPSNFRSVREYTDDLDNADLHPNGVNKETEFGKRWTKGAHRAQGVACVHVRMRQWTKHKIDQRVFRGDVPQISFLLRGMVIEHPDPGAETGTIKQWTNNAAAVRYWYHTVRRGLPVDAINRAEFVRAYRICEERITPTKPDEWNDPDKAPDWSFDNDIWGFRRYSIDGVLESGEDPAKVEREFDAQWQGNAVEDGGQYLYFPGTNDIESDVIDVDGEDAIELVSIATAPSVGDRVNAITVSLAQSSFEGYDRQTLEEVRDEDKITDVDQGITLPTEMTLRWSTNPAQAYMLAIGALRRNRHAATYSLTLPPGDTSNPLRYVEMTAGRTYSLHIPSEEILGKRVVLVEKNVSPDGLVTATFVDSPSYIYTPSYALPSIPEPPPYIPTRLGARPIKPTGLKVDTIARTSSDGTIHFQIAASVDANPLRVKFRLTYGDSVVYGESNDNAYTFDINAPRQQMEMTAVHIDSGGLESLPARLIFTPDYRLVVMPTPRWDSVENFGSNLVMKFKPEEFTNAVSGVEVRYTRLGVDTTAELPLLTESNWATLGELLTTEKLQLIHGVVITANGVAPQSGRYNLYARFVSNVSGTSPIRGPISAAFGITLEIPEDEIEDGSPSVIFDGTMHNLDRWVSRSGNTKGETLLLPSHSPASDLLFDHWNGNVPNSAITTEPLPAWPFGRCEGFGESLDETGRDASTGLLTGGGSTFYRTLPIDLGSTKRVDVRAEVHPFEPNTQRVSAITFSGESIPIQRWKSGTAVPSIPLPIATGNFGAITYSIAGLPAGLSFNPSSRTISGTPAVNTASGAATYTASDASGGTASIPFNWTIAVSVPTPGVMGVISVDPGITSAVASWFGAANASEYRVERSTDNSTWVLVGTTTSSTIDVGGLTAATTYYLRVRGESSGGEGQWGSVSFVTRDAIVIPTTPTGLTLVDATNDTILIRWSPQSNANYYDVRWKAASDSSFSSGNSKSTLTLNTTSIENLSKNTAYHVQVRGGNVSGVSAWTDNFNVSTANTVDTDARFGAIEHIGGERPHLKITTNTLDGETGTEITRQLVSDDGRLDTSVYTFYEDPGVGPFFIYNVSAGNTYRIGLRKTFFPEDGNNLNQLNRATDWVYQTIVFTSVLPPPKPARLQTNGAGHDSLSIYARSTAGATAYRFKWHPITEPGNVGQHTLSYTPPAGSFYEQAIPYVIPNLDESTEYAVTIEAQNPQGWSLPSEVSKFSTTAYEGTPQAIAGLEVYPFSPTAVILIWSDDSEAKDYDIEHDGSPSQLVTGVSRGASISNIVVGDGKSGYLFSNLSPSTSYLFSIRGRNPNAPDNAHYGEWSNFPTITTPSSAAPYNQYVMPHGSISAARGTGREIDYTISAPVDAGVKLFQVRFKEIDSSQVNALKEWQVIPNAGINTHASGTRVFTGSFDPTRSKLPVAVEARAWVGDDTGAYDAGFSDWLPIGSPGYITSGEALLTSITPLVRQIPGFSSAIIEFNPYTEEFETPNAEMTRNNITVAVNGTTLPFKTPTYRAGSSTPIYSGIGIYDGDFRDQAGVQIPTSQKARRRTSTARIQLHNVRVIGDSKSSVQTGYLNGTRYGAFLWNAGVLPENELRQVTFDTSGHFQNITTGRRYEIYAYPRIIDNIRYVFWEIYSSVIGFNNNTPLIPIMSGTAPVSNIADYDWSGVRINVQEEVNRSLVTGDVITAKVDREDPNQRNITGGTASYTMLPPTSVPSTHPGSVRLIRPSVVGKDVVFSWDDVDSVDGYEVSIVEDIPGEPYEPEGGGSSQTTTTVVEQVSNATSYTKVGGRNEHFTIKVRTYSGTSYSAFTQFVYAPPPATNTVGKVFGLVADDVGLNVRLRWGAVDNATGYSISTSTDNGNTWSTPITTTERSHVLEDMSSTDFNVRVRAYKGTAAPYTYSLSYSILSWKATSTLPANQVEDVRSLVAVSRNGNVYLDWTEADDADTYAIQYLNNGVWTEITDQVSSTTTTWQTSISDANNTDFRVRGEHPTLTNGNWTRVDYIAETDTTLAAPSIYAIVSYTSIGVSWVKVGGATAYEVQYRKGTSGDWTTFSNNVVNAPATITGLDNATNYQVRVRAKEGTNAGSWSSVLSTSTLLCSGLAAPTGVVITPLATQFRISWGRVTNATGYAYEVYTSQNPNSGFGSTPRLSVDNVEPSTTSVDVSPFDTLSPPYYIRVRVRAKQGNCPATNWSNYQTILWEPTSAITNPAAPFELAEGGNAIQVGVRLTTRPTGNVTATLAGSSSAVRSRSSVSGGPLTFSTTNWDTDQYFTITPSQHDTDSVDNTYSNAYTLTLNGGGYNNVRKTYGATFKDLGVEALVVSKSKVDMDEGTSTSLSVKLRKQPTSGVSVSVSSLSTSVATTSPSTLSFSTSNWDTGQPITITAPADDDFDDSSTSVRLSATGGGYNGVTETIPVNVTDVSQGLVFDSTSDILIEEGSSISVKAKLASSPNGFGTINASSNNSDISVTPSFRNYSNSNWDEYQTFIITANQDADKTNETAVITFEGGLAYTSAPDVTINVTAVDDDNRNLVVSTPSLTFLETSSGNVRARLSSRPTGNVVVSASVSDTSVASVTPSSRTFTTSNWNTDQNFQFRGVNDATLDNRATSATISTSGGGFSDSKSVSLTVNDNSSPRVHLSSYTFTTKGTPSDALIRLSHRPTGNVSVAIAVSNINGTITSNKTSLTFTRTNWNVAQAVTLNGSGGGSLHARASVSFNPSGGGYDSAPTYTLNARFNAPPASETPRIETSSTTINLNEGSSSTPITMRVFPQGSYRVTATAAPVGKVLLGWSNQNTDTVGRINNGLVVTARQDSDETDDRVTITLSATRTTGGASIPNKEITVNIDDDDVLTPRTLIVSAGTLGTTLNNLLSPFTSSNEAARTISVRLSHQPTSNVNISMALSVATGDSNVVSLSRTSMTFTRSNWNSAQTFRINANSSSLLFTGSGTITINPSGGGYESTPTTSINYRVAQPTSSPVLFFQGSVPSQIGEGETATIDLRMRNQSGNAYNITPSASPSGVFSFNSNSYSVVNGRIEGGIKVTAVHDADTTDEDAVVTFTASRGGAGSYPIPSSISATIKNFDDDANRLVITPIDAFAVQEAASKSIQVRPSRAPVTDITVTPSLPAGVNDIIWTPNQVTFTPTNWSNARSFNLRPRVTPDDDRSRFLTLTASGSGWDGVTARKRIDIKDDIGFIYRFFDVADFDGYEKFGVRWAAKRALYPSEAWQFFIQIDGTILYASRVIRGSDTDQTQLLSGTWKGYSAGYNTPIRLLCYQVFGSAPVIQQPTPHNTGIPFGWRLIGITDNVRSEIRAPSRGGSQSASALASSEISASGGGEPVDVDADTATYHFVSPIVSAPAVRPYFDGHIADQVWLQDKTIDTIPMPPMRGGSENYRVEVDGLPSGVHYNHQDSEIYGTPTDTAPKAGVATIKLIDSNGNFDQREMAWHIAQGVPASWSEFGGGIGQINNPFQMECSTKGNIKPFFYIHGGTNAHDIENNLNGARSRVMWMRCPTTYPHIAKITHEGDADYDLVVKVGDDFFFSDTADPTEIVEVDGNTNGALIGVYRYESTTDVDGVNNTGDPIVLEWIPTIVDEPAGEVGGVGGIASDEGSGTDAVATTEANAATRVPGRSVTDTYALYRTSTTGAWSRVSTPLSQGWNEVPHDARQICFEFHFREWENRAIRKIRTFHRDHEDND